MRTMQLHRAPPPPGGPQTASSASYFIIFWRIKSTCLYLHVLHAFIMHLFAKHVIVRRVIRSKSPHEETALKSPLGWAVTWQVTSADRSDGMIDSRPPSTEVMTIIIVDANNNVLQTYLCVWCRKTEKEENRRRKTVTG